MNDVKWSWDSDLHSYIVFWVNVQFGLIRCLTNYYLIKKEELSKQSHTHTS